MAPDSLDLKVTMVSQGDQVVLVVRVLRETPETQVFPDHLVSVAAHWPRRETREKPDPQV